MNVVADLRTDTFSLGLNKYYMLCAQLKKTKKINCSETYSIEKNRNEVFR